MHQVGIEALDDEPHVSSQRAKSLQQGPPAVGRDLDKPETFLELDGFHFATFGGRCDNSDLDAALAER
jgi:hypothetical protein